MACAQDKESWTYIDDNIHPQKKHVELKDISGSSKSWMPTAVYFWCFDLPVTQFIYIYII